MSRLKIALLQMVAVGSNQQANENKGQEYCRRAAGLGADIALFPEMWNIGYASYDPREPGADARWQTRAIRRDGEFVQHFQALARELDMAIALTYLEQWDPLPRNTISLIDRHGDLVLTYAKVHTCAFDWEAGLTPGEDFYVAALDTAAGPVQIGAMICFDREFPESARILMLKHAEIILTPNACELEANRLGQFKARAFENMVGLAMANYAAPQENGHSIAVDAIAFNRDGTTRDSILVEAGVDEGIYVAEFDLDAQREYRAHEVWGDAFRRRSCYGPLVAPKLA